MGATGPDFLTASAVEGPREVLTACPVAIILGAVFLQLTLLTCKQSSCHVLNLVAVHVLTL